MAIQIRRGTNTEWESNNSNIVVGEPAIATDAERFFVGTASGDYAEFANLDIIAPAYDTSTSYVVGDVINRHGKLYSCNTPCSGSFNPSYWDEKSLAEILKDLENEIDYAQYEIGYASGELITIDNGASEIPVKDLTLDIEAVQDLHGYDHPWAGGTGKNLCPPLTWKGMVDNTTGVYSAGTNTDNASTAELIPVDFANNTTYALSYDSSALPAGVKNMIYAYNANKEFLGRTNGQATNPRTFDKNSFTSSTTSATGDPAYIRVRAYNVNYTKAEIANGKFQIEVGNTVTTFEPWANICPISGWDEVNVNVRGKNYWTGESSITRASSGFYIATGNILATSYPISLPKGTVYLKGHWSGATAGQETRLFYADGTSVRLSTAQLSQNSDFTISVTLEKDAVGMFMYINQAGTLSNIMLTYEENAEYVPYNGQTYTIDLDGTRYGGTLDVTTGVLTVDKFFYSFTGNETFATNSAWGNYAFLYNSGVTMESSYRHQSECISSHLQVVTSGDAWGSLTPNHFMIAGSTYIGLGYDGTQGQLKAWLSAENSNGTPVQVIGILATPQVVQLTPTQVRTVLGTNNLWNQMNSNNELAYRISNALN